MIKNEIKPIVILVFVSFIIKLSFFISLRPWETEVLQNTILVSDSIGYYSLANDFINNNFSFQSFDGLRTPVYPIFVGFLLLICNQVWFVLIVQICISLISIVLIYKLCRIYFNATISFLAALLLTIDIHHSLYTVSLLTDSLFSTLLLYVVYLFVKFLKYNSKIDLYLVAFLLGVVILTRPIALYMPLMFVFFIVFSPKNDFKAKIKQSISFLAICFLVVLPWLVHIKTTQGYFKLTYISGPGIIYEILPFTEAYKTGKNLDSIRNSFIDIAKYRGCDFTKNGNNFKNAEIIGNIASEYIKANPVSYAQRHILGVINMYCGVAIHQIALVLRFENISKKINNFGAKNIISQAINFFESKTSLEIFVTFFIIIILFVNYFFSLIGLFCLVRQRQIFGFLILALIIYFSALTGVIGMARYRLQFMPYINLLAAFGIAKTYFYLKSKYSNK